MVKVQENPSHSEIYLGHHLKVLTLKAFKALKLFPDSTRNISGEIVVRADYVFFVLHVLYWDILSF